MMIQTPAKGPFAKAYDNTLLSLPAPKNISLMWNMGSLLFMCLTIQMVTGVLLASTYSPSMLTSFSMITENMISSEYNWLIRYTHANGASLFFACLYIHIGRAIYYNSFLLAHTWLSGVSIFMLTMATAFMGYVLPLNQMSFWGASVITSLLSEIPYLGPSIIDLVWGAPSVSSPTVIRFMTFHFALPFIILMLTIIHIITLHKSGSSNPIGVQSHPYKIKFNLFFSLKDLQGVLLTLMMFSILIIFFPLLLGDNENFVLANPSITPHHIQPEWYFLFAYAILRSIPNKLGGVIALLLSVTILYFIPMIFNPYKPLTSFHPAHKMLFWLFINIVILLTWIGARPVSPPFILLGQTLTLLYFSYFFIISMLHPLTKPYFSDMYNSSKSHTYMLIIEK